MRILIIHNKYKIKGGEDTVCENEAEMLEKNGNIVKVYYFDNTNIKGMFSQLVTAVFSAFNPITIFRIWFVVKKFKPDIIHVHNFFPLVSPSIFWAAFFVGTPIVFTLHNFRLLCPNALLFLNGQVCTKCLKRRFQLPGVLNRCYRESMIQTFVCAFMNFFNLLIGTWTKVSPQYIALTNFAKDLFLSNGPWLKRENFNVKPNFSIDCGIGQKNRDDYYLYVGRLSEEKGIDQLIKSFKYHNKKIVIVGAGPLEEFVKKSTLENQNLKYEGEKSKNQCIELMKICKALIFPSIWFENFPMTILEALSTATPIIYNITGALPDIVPNGIAGIGYKAIDGPQALGQAIEQFETELKNINFYNNARELYERNYTPEINYKILKEIYLKSSV